MADHQLSSVERGFRWAMVAIFLFGAALLAWATSLPVGGGGLD